MTSQNENSNNKVIVSTCRNFVLELLKQHGAEKFAEKFENELVKEKLKHGEDVFDEFVKEVGQIKVQQLSPATQDLIQLGSLFITQLYKHYNDNIKNANVEPNMLNSEK